MAISPPGLGHIPTRAIIARVMLGTIWQYRNGTDEVFPQRVSQQHPRMASGFCNRSRRRLHTSGSQPHFPEDSSTHLSSSISPAISSKRTDVLSTGSCAQVQPRSLAMRKNTTWSVDSTCEGRIRPGGINLSRSRATCDEDVSVGGSQRPFGTRFAKRNRQAPSDGPAACQPSYLLGRGTTKETESLNRIPHRSNQRLVLKG